MIKHILPVLALFLSQTIFSQNIIQGTVTNKKSGEPLAYVNIGIKGKNVGTVSDSKGNYELNIKDSNLTDALTFSMLGFEVKEISISALKIGEANNIKLNETAYKLDEVIITDKELKTRKSGVKARKDWTNSGFTSNELGNEIGTRININKVPAVIEKVKFRIAYSKFDTVFLRMNIYNVVDDEPSENLLKQNVFLTTTIKNGDVEVDLSQYNISIDSDIIVTLELVKHLGKGGLMFTSRKLSKGGVYFRNTSLGDWHKFVEFTIAMDVTTLVEK